MNLMNRLMSTSLKSIEDATARPASPPVRRGLPAAAALATHSRAPNARAWIANAVGSLLDCVFIHSRCGMANQGLLQER